MKTLVLLGIGNSLNIYPFWYTLGQTYRQIPVKKYYFFRTFLLKHQNSIFLHEEILKDIVKISVEVIIWPLFDTRKATPKGTRPALQQDICY